MALTQKINVKKFLAFVIEINTDIESRFSLLDAQILIALCDKTELSNKGLVEHIDAKRSSVDRPLKRLIAAGLVVRKDIPGAASKSGEERSFYKLTRKGLKGLEDCY